MKIKQSEARIIIYLSVVPDTKKKLTLISQKLGMDYGFCIRILNDMEVKGWAKKQRSGRYMNYDLTPEAPVEQAKEWYNSTELQRRLEDDNL